MNSTRIAAAAILASIAFGASAAGAQTCADSTADAAKCAPAGGSVDVGAVTLDPAPVKPISAPVAAAPAAPVAVAAKQQLPVTGSDAGTLAVIGGAMVLGGAVLTVRSRRATTAPA